MYVCVWESEKEREILCDPGPPSAPRLFSGVEKLVSLQKTPRGPTLRAPARSQRTRERERECTKRGVRVMEKGTREGRLGAAAAAARSHTRKSKRKKKKTRREKTEQRKYERTLLRAVSIALAPAFLQRVSRKYDPEAASLTPLLPTSPPLLLCDVKRTEWIN